jgi:hypothetical protein
MTPHSSADDLGRGGFTDVWRKAERGRLKMLVADLKRCLNSRTNAIRQKAVEASSTLLKVTDVGPLPSSFMPKVAGGEPRQSTVVFDVVTAIR